MGIDLPASISELLFEYESVIIPGFGAFVASNKASVIDHVQGKLQPPSKKLTFNDNILVNDGVLIHHLQKKYQIGQAEAEQAIDTFIEEMQEALDRKEIIEFPKVGRLYRDFENSYKFLQDSVNYNTQSFGLPSIQFFPVVRREIPTPAKPPTQIPKAAAGAKVPPSKPEKKPRVSGNWLQTSMPWVILLSIVIITLSIYFLQKDFGSGSAEEDKTIPVSRVNTKPGKEDFVEPAEDLTDLTEERTQLDGPPEENRQPAEELDTEQPTPAPNQKEVVVIIGAFGDEANAQKVIQEIYQAGYDAFSDKSGATTRVGVQFAYETEQELDNKLAAIRKAFNEKAWILTE